MIPVLLGRVECTKQAHDWSRLCLSYATRKMTVIEMLNDNVIFWSELAAAHYGLLPSQRHRHRWHTVF